MLDEIVQFASSEVPVELVLKPADERLGQASLFTIDSELNRLFGTDAWLHWEPETISIELKQEFDVLMLDKLQVLQIIRNNPDMFYEDPAFLLYATEVINNNVANFELIPSITSLELAYALRSVERLLTSKGVVPEYGEAITKTTAWILNQEGYSENLSPFQFVPNGYLTPGQTEEDTEAKRKALRMYLSYMGFKD